MMNQISTSQTNKIRRRHRCRENGEEVRVENKFKLPKSHDLNTQAGPTKEQRELQTWKERKMFIENTSLPRNHLP